jgi:phosphoribosyl-ATP pyrophosphohydrolase
MPGDSEILNRVFATVKIRASADPATSYVAALYAKGRGEIARKVGEESTEVVIAAISGGHADVVDESADLLFHLMVLWSDCGVEPTEVLAELARREGTSGLDEKAGRFDSDSS